MIAGQAALELGRLELAKVSLARAVELEPEASALTMLAHVHTRLGEDDESDRCLRRAIALDPDYEEAHYDLGIAAIARHDDREALACFRRAIELDPSYSEAHAEVGRILWKLGRDRAANEAERHLRRSLELDPSRCWTHLVLGSLLWGTARLVEAEASYSETVRVAPNEAAPRRCHADILRVLGRDDEAEQQLRLAIAIDPDDAEAHRRLARLLEETHRDDEA